MDTTEDERLRELKSALANMPLCSEPKIESTAISWLDSLDIAPIPALTTIDLSQFTNTPNTAPFSNTAIQLGTPITTSTGTTIYTLGGAISGGGGSGGGGGGGYGYVYPSTTTGTGATWTGTPPITTITADDVIVKGRSIVQALDRIEERLGILDCDESLEKEWEALRELGQEYRKMKQRIEDKMKTFNTLKK